MSLDISGAHVALILLDFQRDVCEEGGKMVSSSPEVMSRFSAARAQARRLLDHVRGLPNPYVVHVTHQFEPGYPELFGAPLNGMSRHVITQGAFVSGTPGAEIVEELRPEAGETVLRKTAISAFETTDLATRLQRRHINCVLLCGTVTHYAVLATALSAADKGFRVVVASDACASGSPERHEAALGILAPLADVASVDVVVAALEPPAPID